MKTFIQIQYIDWRVLHMILYNEHRPLDESVAAAEGIFGEQATPAHYYGNQNDLNIILEDILSGAIPSNTKQPFPVIWKADKEALLRKQQQQYGYPSQQPPFDPPYQTIRGVENLFG